jgi:hypothetical protein
MAHLGTSVWVGTRGPRLLDIHAGTKGSKARDREKKSPSPGGERGTGAEDYGEGGVGSEISFTTRPVS